MDLETLNKHYPVSTEIKVKWGEMDAFQHLNNTVYIRYIEDGRIDLLEKLGMSSDMKSFNIGPILASIQCDYLAPVTYPDTIIVFSTVNLTFPNRGAHKCPFARLFLKNTRFIFTTGQITKNNARKQCAGVW